MLSHLTAEPIGLEDLTLLANLSEKDIKENLKLRFGHDLIYTNIGNVLLSVNPYKAIPFLYDSEMIEFYKAGGKERGVANVLALQRAVTERAFRPGGAGVDSATAALAGRFVGRRRLALGGHHERAGGGRGLAFASPEQLLRNCPQLSGGPHVFQLANSMYRQLLNEEENQAVIISGESGAGKTEASKQIINFISYISERERTGTRRAQRAGQEKKNGEAGEAGPGLAGSDSAADASDPFDTIKSIILESNPLLEAFGNAKTVRNDNSSRFGKFLEMYFLRSSSTAGSEGPASAEERAAAREAYGMPVGGRLSVFLLEKSRVVQQQLGERNFHIFYQMLAGLDAETKAELRLDMYDSRRPGGFGGVRTKPGFNYVCSGRTTTADRIDDKAEFEQTRHAMRVVGISDTVQRFIFEALATILHLGEIEFTDDVDEDGAGGRGGGAVSRGRCRVRNRDTLEFVASLLKLEGADALEQSLTVKKLEVGERSGGAAGRQVQVVEVPLDLAGCANNRDAVAKLLYDALFTFIVYFVNHSLEKASAFTASAASRARGAEERDDVLFHNFAENMKQESVAAAQEANAERFLMLGVLDIYGFEIFANNSFEQFCINYINEKLHQIFIDLTLKREQEEYEQEGVTLPHKLNTFFDNQRILNVIEGSAGGPSPGDAGVPGMFQLLDDICVSLAKEPEEVADAKFLEKLDVFLSSSQAAAPFFQKSDKSGYFTVKHYAGSVSYNVNGFVTKNKDRVSNAVLEVLRGSQNIFVTEILSPTIFAMDEEGARGVGGRRRQTFPSAGRRIREQADSLVEKLRQSTIHYIRTIKPNEEKKPDLFVDEAVLHQVQYLGLMENVKIRKMGFIYRTYFDVFLHRFNVIFSLMNERLRRQEYRIPGSQHQQQAFQPFQFLEHDEMEGCRVLLSFAEHEAANRRASFDASSWQLGKTKVFIRQPAHLVTLERLREACVEAKVRKIQRCFRAYRSEKANTLLKQKMARIYVRHGKTRRTDSVFRVYGGDYLDVKSNASFFTHNAVRNHRDLLRILRYDPLAVGWREVVMEATGKLYYVNLFTGESQWTKPPAMAERELYNNYIEGPGGAEGEEAVNVDGVRVIFSAKVDRVTLVEPLALSAAAVAPDHPSMPYCTAEEHLLVVTTKALFLLREVLETITTVTPAPLPPKSSSSSGRRTAGRTAAGTATTATTTSHLELVKRVDLRLLRGITVSPYADDFLYLHVYAPHEPCRPVFFSEPSSDSGNGEGARPPDRAAARRKGGAGRQRRSKTAAVPPAVCESCGRALPPTVLRAHCPCCGRLCCLSAHAGEGRCLSPGARRPLATLLGTNVVDPTALAGVAAAKEATVAAMEAVQHTLARARRRSSARRGSGRAASGGGAPGSEGAGEAAELAAALAAVPGAATVDTLTAEEARAVTCVSVCPLCAALEPMEGLEDVVLKSFLRTELAAFILKEYQRQMGFPLPFRVADVTDAHGRATIELTLGENRELASLLQRAAAAPPPRKDSRRTRRGLLHVAAAMAAAPAVTRTTSRGKRAAAVVEPVPASPPPDFASYRRVLVECVPPSSQGEIAPAASTSAAVAEASTMDVVVAPESGTVRLLARAPAGLSVAVVAALEGRREERRRQYERRRRDEEAALRAKAAAKEQAREEAYQRAVEEKKRARREREEQERVARMWKEEEHRLKREAAARAVAEKARKGF